MKILMTGATGLVGKNLKAKLEERGHEVVALGRKDFPPTTEQIKNANGLIHLAGENVAAKRWTASRKKALRDSRVETAAKIRDVLREQKQKLDFVVSASGIGFYGDRGDEWLTETSQPGDDFLSRLCLEWEAVVDTIPAERHVKLRLGAVLSSEGGFIKEVAPLFRKFGASRLGTGKQWFAWIHIDDVVNVFIRAVEENMRGAYNLNSPNPVTNEELTSQMAKVLGVWRSPSAPKLALKLLYGELTTALLGSQRARPEKLLNEGYRFAVPELNRALAELF